jgi:ATP-dependent Clp protease ATP-binding subunit ClpA
MYEKFTDRARKVMQLANQEAGRQNRDYIGTEHILLGLVTEGSGVAASVLKNFGVNLAMVQREIEKVVQPREQGNSVSWWSPTPRAKNVIEYAIEEARCFGGDYVSTEHLLLGLAREKEGVGARVLTALGLNLKNVREEVLAILTQLPDWTDAGLVVDFVKHPADANASVEYLPEPARMIVAEFESQIAVARNDKGKAVAVLDFEKAGILRDLEYKVRKLRDEFINQWPKS